MEFTLDAKITENRERLKYDLKRIEKISNNYSFYFIFLSFIGLYVFDFILKAVFILKYNQVHQEIIFLLAFGLSLVFIIVSLIHFILLFIPRKTAHDYLPKEIYVDYRNDIERWIIEVGGGDLTIDEELKTSYLETLEKTVEWNFDLYIKKRSLYFKTIFWALFALIPYIISIIVFKAYYYECEQFKEVINIF